MWANYQKVLTQAIVAIVFAAVTSTARADFIREYPMSGNWVGGVYSYADTKRFSHCVASTSYRGGTLVLVSIDERFNWYLGFSNDQWRLKQGSQVPLFYRFDNGIWLKATGEAQDEHFLKVSMPSDSTLIDLFRRGRRMDLTFSQGVYEFVLDGTFRLTAALAKCVADFKGEAGAITAEVPPPDTSPPRKPVSRGTQDKATPSTGTGIVISTNGHVLTNNHVISQCKSLSVIRSGDVAHIAHLLRADPQNDLAIIKVETQFSIDDLAVFRTGKSVRAGETVAVFGFPLVGTLSVAGNISSGNVTALSGIGDDVRYFQISAPVQPGNSGGPLIDASGLVIGIVTARLNDGAAIASSGAIPQNVNFALKQSVAISFLEAHSFEFRAEMPQRELPLVDVTDRAKRFSVLIICE